MTKIIDMSTENDISTIFNKSAENDMSTGIDMSTIFVMSTENRMSTIFDLSIAENICR